MKQVFIFLMVVCFVWPMASQAAEPVEVYYFADPQCSLCTQMESTLAQMKKSYPEMRVITFNVSSGDETALILQDLFSIYQPTETDLPAVFVGTQVFTGYDADVVQGIAQTVDTCRQQGCQSPSSLLRGYYAQISQQQASRDRFPTLLFWAIFMILWPIIGGIAIVVVLRKHRAHLINIAPARPRIR